MAAIILETGYQVEPDEILELLKSLRKACRADVEVQHRTADEAHGAALRVKKDMSGAASVGAVVSSPFWCLPDCAGGWDDW